MPRFRGLRYASNPKPPKRNRRRTVQLDGLGNKRAEITARTGFCQLQFSCVSNRKFLACAVLSLAATPDFAARQRDGAGLDEL